MIPPHDSHGAVAVAAAPLLPSDLSSKPYWAIITLIDPAAATMQFRTGLDNVPSNYTVEVSPSLNTPVGFEWWAVSLRETDGLFNGTSVEVFLDGVEAKAQFTRVDESQLLTQNALPAGAVIHVFSTHQYDYAGAGIETV